MQHTIPASMIPSELRVSSMPPIMVNKCLAFKIGMYKALIIQVIHELNLKNELENREESLYGGNYWVRHSAAEFATDIPLSPGQIMRHMQQLKKNGIICTANYNNGEFTAVRWYRINYETLQNIIDSKS